MVVKFSHIFKNVDMRNQHDGLQKLAQKHKVNLAALNPGELVVFVNANLNKIKIYSPDGSPDGVLSYKRSSEKVLNMGIIEQIPHCFGANGKINWDAAEKKALQLQIDRALSKK